MLDNQMSAPSGVKPAFRTSTVGLLPFVRLTKRPLPTWLTHVSIGPSRSDRKTTNRPSREIDASFSAPSKFVNRVNCAFASGLSGTLFRDCHDHTPNPVSAARTRAATHSHGEAARGDVVGAPLDVEAAVINASERCRAIRRRSTTISRID